MTSESNFGIFNDHSYAKFINTNENKTILINDKGSFLPVELEDNRKCFYENAIHV